MKQPINILQKIWGHTSFRTKQEEIITSVLDKKDTIALLPTGGGKSICYQIPGILQEGVCLVISPLVALMQDQVDNLIRKNIKAIALNTPLSQDEMVVLFDNIKFNNIKFLYLSPERLRSEFIQKKIQQLHVSLVAIDEAHCISEWGHDFRPAYLQLHILKELCPNANTIALTATATPKVLKDIATHLQMESSSIFKNSFEREQLAYQIFEVEDKFFKIKQILTKIKEPSIIYTNTRNNTKKLSDYLNSEGFESVFYHGGLSTHEKTIAYTKWYSEEAKVMVATNAFGMGIDKANIRTVIHTNLPNSIENYLQEAGRGGRDGKKAFAVTLVHKHEKTIFLKNHLENQLSIKLLKEIYRQLNQYFQIALGEIPEKIFQIDVQNFSTTYKIPFSKVYTAIQTLHREGILLFNESQQQKSYLKFIASNEYVLNYCNNSNQLSTVIKIILRSYGGLFDNFISIHEDTIAKKAKLSKKELIILLHKLDSEGILQYNPRNTGNSISFLVPREDDKTINRISKNIKHQQNHKLNKAKELLRFVENNQMCRSIQLLNYFHEKDVKECGICDVCIQKKKNTKDTRQDCAKKIKEILSKHKQLTSREITSQIPMLETTILRTLQLLLEEDKIAITKGKYYVLKNNI